MTTSAALLTRLYGRLGITTASAAEEACAEEALNGALCWVAAKGAPQLRQVYSGYTVDAASPTITHTANSATATLSSVAGIYPGDILVNSTTGRSYLIRAVTTSGATVDLGVPVITSMTGNTISVKRRSIPLANAGTVWSLFEANGNELKMDALVAARKQFDTGVPTHFTQSYAETLGNSYISLFPAPTTQTQYIIVQGPAFTKDGDIHASEAVLQAVLAKAYEFRMLMSTQNGAAQLAAALAAAMEPLRTSTGTATAPITRS